MVPVSASASSTATKVIGYPDAGRRKQDGQQRQHRAEGERERRGVGGVPRVGQLVRVDAQFDVDVRGERVVVGQFLGDQLARSPADRPLARYMATNSASSSSGLSASSRRSLASRALRCRVGC